MAIEVSIVGHDEQGSARSGQQRLDDAGERAIARGNLSVEDSAVEKQIEAAVAEIGNDRGSVPRRPHRAHGTPPDERLRRIVRAIARQAAREHYMEACLKAKRDSDSK